MKKIFISQPMKDKTDKEILAEREKAIAAAKTYLGEEVEVIDSFFQNAPHDAKPLYFLGKSGQLPATKDASLGSETPNCLDTADLLTADQ